MNFGAVLRSAGYFGVDGIIATAKNSYVISYCLPITFKKG